MRKYIDKHFLRLIKAYTLVYLFMTVCYTYLNWYITTKAKVLQVNWEYADYWIPTIICFAFSFFVFRPLVNKLNYKEKAASFSLWFLLPFSIVAALVSLQFYFKDSSYSLIEVEKVSDVLNFPDERFFKIKNYYVFRDRYHVVNEQHKEGRYGTRLVASNYYTSAMYNDSFRTNQVSQIGYGVQFSDEINSSFQSKERQESLIRQFNSKSETDYFSHNFYDGDIFERVFNSTDADYYNYSWNLNRFSNKLYSPTVLVKLKRPLESLQKSDWNLMVYSVPISYFLTILLLFLFNVYKDKTFP